PRVAITYCTQCKWMLRAAYFGQELLSTFGLQIGEIALIPATGGLFTAEAKKVLLWDRKAKGGFPETKVLKQLVRDHIDPNRDLGHSDKYGKKNENKAE
ncbi:Rdx family-domain-containing protein, partial [Alternaria alternata]